MNFSITTDGQVVESFEAAGHRNARKSAHLEALKVASAWGYHKQEGYQLEDEDGNAIKLVDPFRTTKWKKEMRKDYMHIVGGIMKLKNHNDSSLNTFDINTVAHSTWLTLCMLMDTIETKRPRHNKRFQQVAERLIRTVGGAP